MVTRRCMRPAMSMLWVATRTARPEASTSSSKRREDVLRGLGVEIPGRLVGEQNSRRVGDSARDRHPLLLATGKLGRPVGQALLEAKIGEQIGRAFGGFLPRQAADHLRHDDILDRGEFHQQVMELIDEADLGAADSGTLGI